MTFILRALLLLAGVVSAMPLSFPLPNRFPNPNPAALEAIQLQALGTEPNGPVPASLIPSTCTALQLIAFNEIHEVAFFTELLWNITKRRPRLRLLRIPRQALRSSDHHSDSSPGRAPCQ